MEMEIFNEMTETYATVFTTADQIIVTFKGTTSLENMKTDLKVQMVQISDLFPTNKYSKHKILATLDWKTLKFIKGLQGPILQLAASLLRKLERVMEKTEDPYISRVILWEHRSQR